MGLAAVCDARGRAALPRSHRDPTLPVPAASTRKRRAIGSGAVSARALPRSGFPMPARATLAALAVGFLVASLLGAGAAVVDADPAAAAEDDELTSSAVTLTNQD